MLFHCTGISRSELNSKPPFTMYGARYGTKQNQYTRTVWGKWCRDGHILNISPLWGVGILGYVSATSEMLLGTFLKARYTTNLVSLFVPTHPLLLCIQKTKKWSGAAALRVTPAGTLNGSTASFWAGLVWTGWLKPYFVATFSGVLWILYRHTLILGCRLHFFLLGRHL